MFKLLLWDIDGTILNFLAAEKAAIKKCFEILKLGPCDDAMVERYSSINVRYWQMLERGEMSKPEILVGRFSEFFSCYGIDTSLAKAFNDEYQIRLGDTIVFTPHAIEMLDRYKGKIKQCAVTNGTKIAQSRKIDRSGLDNVFDDIFISEDVGYEKPALEFFKAVFDKIGAYNPEEVLIIGDSLTSDITGGINAGIKTCWYNPGHKENANHLPIDYEIADLSELVSIVDI